MGIDFCFALDIKNLRYFAVISGYCCKISNMTSSLCECIATQLYGRPMTAVLTFPKYVKFFT